MVEESPDTDELDDDPEAETDDEQDGDTSENTQEQQPDEELVPVSRYKNLQAAFTRETQRRKELEDRILKAQQPQARSDPTDPLAPQRAALEAERDAVRQEREWNRIRGSKPQEVIDAYEEFQRSYALNPTAEGAVTAWEQSVASFAARIATQEARDQGTQRQPAAPRQRVDTSRSEGPDPDAIDKKIAGAKERHDINAHAGALLGQWFQKRR